MKTNLPLLCMVKFLNDVLATHDIKGIQVNIRFHIIFALEQISIVHLLVKNSFKNTCHVPFSHTVEIDKILDELLSAFGFKSY